LIKYPSEDSTGNTRQDVNDSNGPAVALPRELLANEVHVWLADLNDHLAVSLKPLLALDEVARADRFHFDKDRNHYIVARGLLRKLLAAYLGIGAGDLRFSYAEKGKPVLEESQRGSLNFNLAHSHGRAIYAFSSSREVGVDLEFIRDDLADEKIAQRFFSPREIEALGKLPAELRKEAFFNCWTRKEAYIKARGEGLSMPLDEFDVSLGPGEAAALLRNDKEPGETERWSMQSVGVARGYVAALVAEGHDWRLKTFSLDQLK
jgi:4'-phosphopantetheinyl transferase